MRQQRTNNARGRLQPPSVPRSDLPWTILNFGAGIVQVTIGFGIDINAFTGIPPFTCVETNELPTGWAPGLNSFTLTYATPPPTFCTLRLPNNSAEVRGITGGYLAGGTQRSVPGGIAQDTAVQWTVAGIIGSIVQIS